MCDSLGDCGTEKAWTKQYMLQCCNRATHGSILNTLLLFVDVIIIVGLSLSSSLLA